MRVTRETIGWEDVAEWMFEFEKHYHLRAEISCEPFHTKTGLVFWVWQLTTWTGHEQGRRLGVLQTEERWPSSKYISVPALVIGLVRAHERKLELMETEARQRAFF